jgi:methylenetetrahydrofolate dehydrogenase (NADP+) / methenyltetrahydrofolate cyclohydrolase
MPQAQILDGKQLALTIRARLREQISAKVAVGVRPPGLAVILVGDDPASQIYVRNKERAAEKMGMLSKVIRLGAHASQQEVLDAVEAVNQDPQIDGFLVQLPLPGSIEDEAVTQAICPDKDADGLHPENLGRLMAGLHAPRACTPSGVMALLDEAKIPIEGRHAVVIGRSTIVGKPQALLLLERNATVTLCHSRTQNLAGHVLQADIVVAAVGKPCFVSGDWIKPGAAVIDVGINRNTQGLVGDVDYESAAQKARWITPVPGGVGPMTIAMLAQNTVQMWLHSIDD